MSLSFRRAVNPADIQSCMEIRRQVFMDEQNVTLEEERDGLDDQALHFLALENGKAVGAARVRFLGTVAKIERVAVQKSRRGKGTGKKLMGFILSELRGKPGITAFTLSAQTPVIPFYEALGFSAYGDEYMDARIPHRDMKIDVT